MEQKNHILEKKRLIFTSLEKRMTSRDFDISKYKLRKGYARIIRHIESLNVI